MSKKGSGKGKKRKAKQKKVKQSSLPANRYINRELSWLEFNDRVLDLAADESVPLLERAKFLAITSSNLDEFAMVRVGGLQSHQNSMARDPAGMTVSEQLHAVTEKCRMFVNRQYCLFREQMEPQFAETQIRRINLDECSEAQHAAAKAYFDDEVTSVLSPQSLSLRPFPLLQGLGLQLFIRLASVAQQDDGAEGNDEDGPEWDFAVIPLGKALSRIVTLPSDQGFEYMLLEDLVMHFVDDMFPGRDVLECVPFRITRNADVALREEEADDLLVGMEELLESRRLSHAVRLEYGAGASDPTIAYMSESLQVSNRGLFPIEGPLDLTYLFSISGLEGFESLRFKPWPPQSSPDIDPAESMFSTINHGDVLLVHPYERFDSVVRFIEESEVDPDVLAIKRVLYRTSRNSPIVAALIRAAQHGKSVSAIVELKARFDEARNIEWAREMEHAGVQVIYGIRGLKTHAKLCLVVRREPDGLRRYVHFGTGNYNEVTANVYSDVSLLTCDPILSGDANSFFNAVTGASQPQPFRELAAAPTTLRNRVLGLIEAETQRCLDGQKGEIVAKLNALVDTEVIDALYRASQAGVDVKLNIRGVCCLKPGVAGLSSTIKVVSVVDRFLEHARILYFGHGGGGQVFISSADWMPRNLDRRVELFVPVNDLDCRAKVVSALKAYFSDNKNSWEMTPTGIYQRLKQDGGRDGLRAQWILYQNAVNAMQQAEQGGRTMFKAHRSPRADKA